MHRLAAWLFVIFVHLGGLGLLGLGVLDSSFLVMPLGNDLLIIAMSARNPSRWPYYAAAATAGSVLGCLLIDVVSRKGGEELIERHVARRRFKFVARRIKQDAGWALAFAALMPPPFPFTPFVVAAAALEYPRKKMLSVLAGARFLRFGTEAGLAAVFGSKILRWFSTPAFHYVVLSLIAITVLATTVSVCEWIRKSAAA